MAESETVDVGVGVAAAAGHVGVAAATLRAWERRYGLMPSGHTPGGHRRYSTADIATLVTMREMVEAGMATASAARLIRSNKSDGRAVPSLAQGSHVGQGGYSQLVEAGESLDAPKLARVARSILGQRGVIAAWTEVFVPYLQALGRHWSETGQGVECEHLAVAVLQSVLRKGTLRRRSSSAIGRVALLSAVPGEGHTLPLDALAAALAEAGVASRVVYDLPAVALFDAVSRTPAGPVALWARRMAPGGLSLLGQVSRTRSPIYAAGPGWRADRLPKEVGHLRDLNEAVAALVIAE